LFSGADDVGAAAPNAVRRSEPRSPAGMCRQARGTASAGRAATIPAPVFLLPRKTLRETDGRCRQKRRCHATWARSGVKRAFFPAGMTYLARRTAIHGLERTWGTTCVLRTYFYGRSARLLSFIRFTHLKFSKPMAVLCIDEKVWQAFVGRLETLAERARLLEHRYEPRTDSS
jgi:hypothetical protein